MNFNLKRKIKNKLVHFIFFIAIFTLFSDKFIFAQSQVDLEKIREDLSNDSEWNTLLDTLQKESVPQQKAPSQDPVFLNDQQINTLLKESGSQQKTYFETKFQIAEETVLLQSLKDPTFGGSPEQEAELTIPITAQQANYFQPQFLRQFSEPFYLAELDARIQESSQKNIQNLTGTNNIPMVVTAQKETPPQNIASDSDANTNTNKRNGVYQPLAGIDGLTKDSEQTGLMEILNFIFTWGIRVAVLLAVIMIIFGGVEYMTSDAVFNKEDGIHKINAAIIGLILTLSAWLILYTVNPRIVEEPSSAIFGPTTK